MKTLHSALPCAALAHSGLAQANSWLATQLSYQSEDWGTGQAYGINNSGQVIGVIEPPSPPPYPGIYETVPMAFVTGANGGNLRPIDPGYMPYIEYCHGCHTNSTPQAINDAGQIAMSNFVSWTQELSVTLAGPNGRTVLPPSGIPVPALGVTLGLNNSGQLAGTYYGPPVSFLTDADGNNPHLLDMLDNGYDSNIAGINNSGQLLVSGVVAGTAESKDFITGPNGSGIAVTLGAIGAIHWFGALNDSAQVIGSYQETQSGEYRAFISGDNGEGYTDLGSLGGPTFAHALNDGGLVVGESGGRAFLYGLQGDDMMDLNILVALGAGEYLVSAADINDRGQIVAQSNLGNMYLLTPISEPGVHLLMLGSLALLFTYRRRRFT